MCSAMASLLQIVKASKSYGAQVLLDGTDLSTREPLTLRSEADPPAPTEATTSTATSKPALAENP